MTKRSRGSELYEMVQDYKEWIDRSPADSWIGQLRSQWEKIKPDDYQHENLTSREDNPILDLLDMIIDGQYPPPEYLLMLHTVFGEYFAGMHDLETAAFGPPIKKSGNFAKRKSAFMDHSLLHVEHQILVRSGMRPIDAAEKLTWDYLLSIDAESLLRKFRDNPSKITLSKQIDKETDK